jgi:hypothetical protein
MAPGLFRKIFDKVKGFFSGDAPAIVDKFNESVSRASEGARHVIDKVNETIDYAEPIVRKGLKTTNQMIEDFEPVMDTAQRVFMKKPNKRIQIEEYDEEAPRKIIKQKPIH